MIGILHKTALTGMMFGIALVVQPWWNNGLRVGFFVTLATTIAYIVVSHIPDREKIPD